MSVLTVEPKLTMGLFYLYPSFENKDQFLHDDVSSSVSHLATKVNTCSFKMEHLISNIFQSTYVRKLPVFHGQLIKEFT